VTDVSGVVLIDLDSDPTCDHEGYFIGRPAGVPVGVQVRVLIGNRRWIGLTECSRIALLSDGAASVEIVGTHPPAIAEVVRYLRERLSEAAA